MRHILQYKKGRRWEREEGRGKRGEAFSRLKKGGRGKRGGKKKKKEEKNSHASLQGSIFVEQRKPRKKPSLPTREEAGCAWEPSLRLVLQPAPPFCD